MWIAEQFIELFSTGAPRERLPFTEGQLPSRRVIRRAEVAFRWDSELRSAPQQPAEAVKLEGCRRLTQSVQDRVPAQAGKQDANGKRWCPGGWIPSRGAGAELVQGTCGARILTSSQIVEEKRRAKRRLGQGAKEVPDAFRLRKHEEEHARSEPACHSPAVR